MLFPVFTYQSTTTQKNHKDNEGFKPVVFHYSETGFPKTPPLLSSPFFYTHLAALESLYATYTIH